MAHSITLQRSAAGHVVNNDILGQISFAAPNEPDGTDSILIAASIFARSEGTFAADNNATELVFVTGTTESAAPGATNYDMTLSSAGTLTLVGGLVIADGGNIGSASDTNAIAIASDGVVTMDQIPVFSAGINVSGGTIAGTIATATQNSITTMTGLVTVGTIGTGVWQGTAIASSYIADDAITGAKIALFDDSLAATTTHFLIADGTDYSSFALSGDVTCTNAGVVSLASDITNVATLYKTDIAIGEDAQTRLDFGEVNKIRWYANNQLQMQLEDGILKPASDSDVDLGTTGVRWKDFYVDSITVTGAIRGAIATADEDATVVIDLSTSNYFEITLGANVTDIDFTNGSVGQRFIIRFEQPSGANYSIVYSAVTHDLDGGGSPATVTVSWPGGTAPTMTAENDRADTYGFIVRAEGHFDGYVIGQDITETTN